MISNSNIELTLELREKVKTLVKEVVVKTHSNRNKQMIKDMLGRLTWHVPIAVILTKMKMLKEATSFGIT